MSQAPQIPPSILIVTGHSGSGKSTAIHALEDSGYFCVDNLPAALVEPLVAEVARTGSQRKLALVMDLREKAFAAGGPALVQRLKAGPHPTRLIFLQADEDVVMRRYSQTRRLHPLDEGAGLRAAIVRERAILAPLGELADDTLDTSHMSPHTLRRQIMQDLGEAGRADDMRVSLMSFGFKHGVPLEADMVLDVRFVPNPYFVRDLAAKEGRDAPVRDYVLAQAQAQQFLRHTTGYLDFLLPNYRREGKRYFTLAIGCTGGRHRSVALTEALVTTLANKGFAAQARHRDVGREQAAVSKGAP